MTGTPLLAVWDLTVALPVDGVMVTLLHGVDLSIQRKEFVGLVGESGSGKTLTALSILRLLPPGARVSAARMELAGTDLLRCSDATLRQARGGRVGMVFQEPTTALNPVLSVGYQIIEALKRNGGGRRKAAEKAKQLLDLVGIPAATRCLRDYPHQLSGGQRQRVMIAMALAAEPDLLIADEPTSALDVTVQAQILDLLEELRSRLDLAILLITHDLSVVAESCDQVLVMYAGQIVEQAEVKRLFDSPAHPYSKGLIAAVPRLGFDRSLATLPTLPGQTPHPQNLPSGCSFHPRCAEVLPECSSREPLLVPLADEQQARCLLYGAHGAPEDLS